MTAKWPRSNDVHRVAMQSAHLQGLVTQIETLLGEPLECAAYKRRWDDFGNIPRGSVASGTVRVTIITLLRQAMKTRPRRVPRDLWPTDPNNTANLILGAAHEVANEHGDDELLPVAVTYFLFNLWHEVTKEGNAAPFKFFLLEFRRSRAFEELLDTQEEHEELLRTRHAAAVRAENEFVHEFKNPLTPFVPSTFPQIAFMRSAMREDANAATRLIVKELEAAFRKDGNAVRTQDEFGAIKEKVSRQVGLLEQGAEAFLRACGYSGPFTIVPTHALPDLSGASDLTIAIGNMSGDLVLGTHTKDEQHEDRATFHAVRLDSDMLDRIRRGGGRSFDALAEMLAGVVPD